MDELGEVITTHRGRPVKRLGAVLAGAAMTGFVIWAMFAMHPESMTIAWLIAAGFAAFTVVFSVVMVRDFSTRLEVRARGLRYRRGARETVVRYADIARASTWSVRGNEVALELMKHDGREITISAHLTDWNDVERAVASGLPPQIPTARLRA